MLWNIVFYGKLPPQFQAGIFWANIPTWLQYTENISRFLLFVVTAFMPLAFISPRQKAGLATYGIGLLIYFLSWLPLMLWPESSWSNSFIGFMAPAYTPAIWLTGICIIGDRYYFKFPYSKYLLPFVSIVFIVCHNYHTWMVFARTHYPPPSCLAAIHPLREGDIFSWLFFCT